MTLLNAIILGILQGITEFLPISSSGHLVLGEELLGMNVEALKVFDVVVHMGSLLAILIYFRSDIWMMIQSLGKFLTGKWKDPYVKLIAFILIGTIPAVIVGFTLEDIIDGAFRNVNAVAIWMMVIGLLFFIGEWKHDKEKISEITLWKSLFIGCAQAMALIPGISRSGSTIVAGLFQGINRVDAARFSFLLGIPAIAGAGLLTALKIPENGGLHMEILPLVCGFISSFIFGLLSVHFLMKFLKKHSLRIFALYLILLGLVSLAFNFM